MQEGEQREITVSRDNRCSTIHEKGIGESLRVHGIWNLAGGKRT